jgi:hypothetical protein
MYCIVELEDPDANPVNTPHVELEGEAVNLQDAIDKALAVYPGFRVLAVRGFTTEDD